MTTKKYCYGVADVPTVPHYAILTNDSVSIPGDERSRTNPGHGYPAYTKSFLAYIAFTNYDEWMEEITRLANLSQGTHVITAIQVVPAKVEVKTQVDVTVNPVVHEYTRRCPKCGKVAVELIRDTFATRICACGHRWKPAEDKQ